MAGIYRKVPEDGATYPCSECGKQFTHVRVIQPIHTITKKPQPVICLDCVDEYWFASAVCISSLDGE